MKLIKMMAFARRAAVLLLLAFPLATFAAEQKTFATPDAAVEAFMAALKANDDAALIAIFGAEHKGLVVTPDDATTPPRARNFWPPCRHFACSMTVVRTVACC